MTTGTERLTDAELVELTAQMRTMVDGAFGGDAAAACLDGAPFDRDAWRRLATDYTFFGLHLPEELGGLGASFVHSALAARAAGAAVLPGPYTATVSTALPLLAECAGPDVARVVLPPVLDGSSIVTVAGLGGGLGGTHADVMLAPDDTVSGAVTRVPWASVADHLLTVTRTPSGDAGLALVALTGPAVTMTAQDALDDTRPQFRVDLNAAPVVPLRRTSPATLRGALAQATILVASEAVGGARASLALALDYVTVREQFGRPIGSFQALQHRLVDLFAEVELAAAAVDAAAALVDEDTDTDTLAEAASLAKSVASDAYCTVSRQALHAHGGIGFTWEHRAQLFLKRALTDRALLGTPAAHRRLLADALDHDAPDSAGDTDRR